MGGKGDESESQVFDRLEGATQQVVEVSAGGEAGQSKGTKAGGL